MHTGYNSWTCNRQEAVPNLLNDGASFTNYTQLSCGRQTSNLNVFTLCQKNQTSQNSLHYFQSSQYLTSISNQSSTPEYQNLGAGLHHGGYWHNFGPMHSDNRSSLPQSSNYNNKYRGTYLSYNQNSERQMARIRVRDVNSLNSIAQSSTQNYDKNRPLEWHSTRSDTSEGQYHCFKHRNNLPPLFDVNHLPPREPKPSMYQERISNIYVKPRGQIIQGNTHNLHNIDVTQNEPGYRTTTSGFMMQDLVVSANEVNTSNGAKFRQNIQPTNSPSCAPPNSSSSDLVLPRLLEGRYNLGVSPYRSQLSYLDSLQTTNVSAVNERNLSPPFEQVSPKTVENNAESGESSIRIKAVISLPEWCGRREEVNEIFVPTKEEPNLMSGTDTQETEDAKISNNEPPSVVSNDVPNDSLKVKEESKAPSKFSRDNMSEIFLENMKTEDFQEQEGVSQYKEQISHENTLAGSASTENNNNNKSNKETNDEKKNSNPDKDKINEFNPNPENKFTVGKEGKNTQSEDSSKRGEAKELYYKSKINRDKLDMLIEFINGGDKHLNYASEQRSKKQKKADDSNSTKTSKPSCAKIKCSTKDPPLTVSSKVARVDTARLSPQNSPTVETRDVSIKSKKEEHNPVLEKQPKDVENLNKANTKNNTEQMDFPVCVFQDPKDIQDSHLKKNPEPKTKDVKRKAEKIENKSVTTENQTQVTVAKNNSDWIGKSRKLKTNNQVTEGDRKLEKSENHLQKSLEKLENVQPVDANRKEKPEINQAAEIVMMQLKVSSDSVSPPQENESEKNALEGDKAKATGVFLGSKYHFCETCVTVLPAECFWMNIVSGEIKCSNCFKTMNLNAAEATHELSGEGKNQEAQPNKNNIENVCSPNMKDDPENRTDEKGDDKKNQTHSTRNEEFHEEKRKNMNENNLFEGKMKMRKADEKLSRKTKDDISEALTCGSKIRGVSGSSKSARKSLPNDTSREERTWKNSSHHIRKLPSNHEKKTSTSVSKTRTNWQGAEKWVNSEVEFRCKEIHIVEETNKNLTDEKMRKLMEVLEGGKKYEKTKDSRYQVGREKLGCDIKSNPKKTMFSWVKDVKENHCVKNQFYEKPRDRRRMKRDQRRKREESMRSTKEEWRKKRRTIKRPLQYKDFVLRKSPIFSFSNPVKDASFLEILE